MTRVTEYTPCKNCSHAQYAHKGDCVACGCVKFEPRKPKDEALLREWIVVAQFFVKNRWIKGEIRVRAAGPVGALAKGYRLLKKELIRPRVRIAKHELTLIPISRPKS